MGTASSKQRMDPPDRWEPEGARRAFEVISPTSDISNPSDIYRCHRHGAEPRQLVLTDKSKKQSFPNSTSNRRVSRTVTTSLPIATKVPSRRSNGEDGNQLILEKKNLQFPTKETERYVERAIKSSDIVDKENQCFHDVAPQGVKKTTVGKMLLKKMSACLEDPKEDEMEHPEPVLQRQASHLRQEKLQVAQIVSGRPRGRRSSSSAGDDAPARNVPLQKLKVDAKMKSMQRKNSSTDPMEEPQLSPALHREDEYFDRLSMSPSSIPAASPYVSHSDNRVTAILDKPSARNSYPVLQQKMDPSSKFDRSSVPNSGVDGTVDMAAMTPVSQLVRNRRTSDPVSVDSPGFSPMSDLYCSGSSVPTMQHDDKMRSMRSMKSNASVASSLMRFYTKSGPVGSSPQTYFSDVDEENDDAIQVFMDDQSNASRELKEHQKHDMPFDEESPDERKSVETSSSMYTTESKAYENPNGKDLQVLMHKGNASNGGISFEKSKKISSSLIAKSQKSKPLAHTATFDEDDSSSVEDQNVSKLESLFRPILPALSTDDAQSLSTYDHREIKVTESAPGVIQSSKYIALARRGSSISTTTQPKKNLALRMSPSQVSIDSQASPGLIKDTVSDQAEVNADFLFASDYGPTLVPGNRDSSKLSISTSGARSRLTQRTYQSKEDRVSENNLHDMETRSVSESTYRSDRRVRFSVEATDKDIDVPNEIDRTVSDLTDTEEREGRRHSGIVSLRSSSEGRMDAVMEEEENSEISPAKPKGNWAYKEGNETGVTPCLKGKALKKATNSPFLRFQAAKDKFDTTVAPSCSFAESIDLPAIGNTMSDVTESSAAANKRESEESTTLRSSRSIPESIPEEDESNGEDEEVKSSPENSIHWTYNEKGVTPFVKGKSAETDKAAKSPVRRFKDAKTKFSTDAISKSPSNVESIVRPRSTANKKSPKKEKRIVKKGSGGLVSARIEELNTRVSEMRKIKRLRKKMTNPRLHTHNFDNNQPVRNRALINYKTNIKSADIEKSNSYMAAKFNVIPDVDEDSAISSLGPSPTNGSTYMLGPSPTNSIHTEVSKISHGTFGTIGTLRSEGTGATVATVVQQKDSRSGRYRAYSESTMSTASSGFSKVRKQVLFRVSDGTKSLSSNDESTTLSAVIHKENEFFPPAALHLSPVQRTPMQAMKWRSLAAAAQQKDVRSGKKGKNLALVARNNNY